MASRMFQCLFWIYLVQLPKNTFAQQPPYNRRLDHFTNRAPIHQPFENLSLQTVMYAKAIQMAQDKERRRFELKIERPAARNDNEAYKIVNYAKPNIPNKRGMLTSFRHSDDQLCLNGQVQNAYPRVRDSVVFPGPMSNTTPRFTPQVPVHCAKTGICEDLPNYPEEHVETLLQKIGEDRSRFKIDELEAPEIAQRIGSPDETELCSFKERIIYPKAAPDKDGNWYYTVNQQHRNLQGVRVEICDHNSECHNMASFPLNYEAYCKQKFVLRQLSALDANGRIIEHSFRLPSCCSCVLKDAQ